MKVRQLIIATSILALSACSRPQPELVPQTLIPVSETPIALEYNPNDSTLIIDGKTYSPPQLGASIKNLDVYLTERDPDFDPRTIPNSFRVVLEDTSYITFDGIEVELKAGDFISNSIVGTNQIYESNGRLVIRVNHGDFTYSTELIPGLTLDN